MRWSVGIEAEAGQVMSREQIVELADAVAPHDGIATGIGSTRYGAQLIVQAVELAKQDFARAVQAAGLPDCPLVRVEAISENEEDPAG